MHYAWGRRRLLGKESILSVEQGRRHRFFEKEIAEVLVFRRLGIGDDGLEILDRDLLEFVPKR